MGSIGIKSEINRVEGGNAECLVELPKKVGLAFGIDLYAKRLVGFEGLRKKNASFDNSHNVGSVSAGGEFNF